MPAIRPIVLTDVFGVGKSLNLDPKSVVGSKSDFEDRSIGIYVGFHRASLVTQDMTNARKISFRCRLNYLKQAEGTTSTGYTPAPALDRFDEVEITFKTNNRSTTVERESLINLVQQAMSDITIRSVVVDGEEVY